MVKNLPAVQETQVNSWVGKILWRREQQPTPVFLPREFGGQRSLAGYSPWDHKETDTTEWLIVWCKYYSYGEGNGTPLQYSCLEKSHGQRSLVGCSPWGHKESDKAEWLHFHFHALEKEMATHSSVLAWRIPGMGSHRVGHDWSDLAAAAATIHRNLGWIHCWL